MTFGWSPQTSQYPLPPTNPVVVATYQRGLTDLRWDDPASLSANSSYNIVGVNIYRASPSDRGPYYKINSYPISGNFYRDRIDITRVTEVVNWNTDWIHKADAPNSRAWVLKTKNPCYKQGLYLASQTPSYANSPSDVDFYINGEPVIVHSVFGQTGEVVLTNEYTIVSINENYYLKVPNADDVVEISYWSLSNFYSSPELEEYSWYRIVSVAEDENGNFIETPLAQTKPCSIVEVESLDYIWKEAVRRNGWILQQGGERVKLFIKKVNGIKCLCRRDDKSLSYTKQPTNLCMRCYGTGYLGGYEGPYDIIIAPDNGPRGIKQSPKGRNKDHNYEVFMGPSPLVTQRDFIVKQTNERYAIGAVNRPSNRGNLLQQHFSISFLDEADIRYRVPMDGVQELTIPETRGTHIVMPRTPVTGEKSLDETEGWATSTYPEGEDLVTPVVTEKDNTPDHVEKRGRTKAWENINY